MKATIDRILLRLDEIVLGKPQAVRLCLCCLLARGHLLIEDIPGVGKTTLANAISRLLGLPIQRVQFTSDLLPGDIIGSSIFDPSKQEFIFHPGPLFSEVLLADEINRTTPKTQSALLEAMEERQVSVDGRAHLLPNPFFVIATQNPGHQIGTFPLPESQLDRFMMKISLGYPDRESERAMLQGPSRQNLIRDLEPVITLDTLRELQDGASQIHISEPVRDYILDLLSNSRENIASGSGLSPRGGLALQGAAKAWALMKGRDMVLPEDVQDVAPVIMAHRLGGTSGLDHENGKSLAEALLNTVAVP